MWTSDGITFYSGDRRTGDRAATLGELAAYELQQARRDKRGALTRRYDAAVRLGAPHRGKRFQIDAESRGNIGDMAQLAGCVVRGELPAEAWPAAFESKGFRCLDNTHLPVTPAQMIALGAAVGAHFATLRFNLARLKDLIDAPDATIEEIEAIDTSMGWN